MTNDRNFSEPLPCGCIRGSYHCEEAVRLWREYGLAQKKRDRKRMYILAREYDRHFLQARTGEAR